MSILEQTVDRSITQGWIPKSDRQAVINRVNQLATKYKISGDDLAIITITEAGGFKPTASNGSCYGIIQFCGGTGAATVGYPNASDIANLSVLEQLDLTDKYFEAQGLVPGSDLEDLYLTILYPAARSIKDRNVDLGIPPQAEHLRDSQDRITRDSLRKGLESQAALVLGTPIKGSFGQAGVSNNLPGSPSLLDQLGSAFSALSTFITSGENCPPPEFTLDARLTYTGCTKKIKDTKAGGIQGLGYPAGANVGFGAANGAGGYAGLNKPFLGPAAPGSYIRPTDAVKTSDFGPRWGRQHKGVDFGGPEGSPIVAASDGFVIFAGDASDGYGNKIIIQHQDGNQTLYAHLQDGGVLVQNNQEVKAGQPIGKMGSTGHSTGSHLHFEIIDSTGTPVNPCTFISC